MSIRKKDPKIVISGYYGFDNCGDEAVLLAIIRCLRELWPTIRITVLSGNPEKTRETFGVNAVSRWNPIIIAFHLLTCRLLISGGGSLLQDVTSAKSPLYYLGVIRIALLLRKKVMIYSQGVGPLNIAKNRIKVAKTLRRCHSITLRDDQSAWLLRELGVNRNIQVSCDPVMALDREDADNEGIKEEFLELGIFDSLDMDLNPLLLAAVRCWEDDSHIASVAEFLDTQLEEGWDILLVPMHYPSDVEAIFKITSRMSKQPYFIDKCLTAREFLALAAVADMVFSMRLHGLICAMAVGTPVLGLSYDPKVEAFMEQAGLERYCLSFDEFNWETAKRLMEELDNLPYRFRQEREARRLEMQTAAWETAELAISLLDDGSPP